MRKFSTLLVFIFLSVIVLSAQEQEEEYQTIGSKRNGSNKVRISGFAGPMMSFTHIDNQFAHMMGGGAGIIIGNFFFGGYGMGKTTELTYRDASAYNMNFGHGGFWLGYTFFHNKAIHPVFHVQSGWGLISKTSKDYQDDEPTLEADQVFVVAPTAELEMNFSQFFKLGAGLTYSMVYNTGQQTSPYSYEDFSNLGIFVSLKFGWFK